MITPSTTAIGFVEWNLWGRSKPFIPVNNRWIRFRLSRKRIKVVLQLKDAGVNLFHLSKLSSECHIGRQFKVWNTTTLSSRLEDSLVFLDIVVQFLAFLNVHRTGLFTINVFACTSRVYRCRGMPAVPRGDKDCINIIPF